MQFNYYFLKHLSLALNNTLPGKKLVESFSQNKDELILAFESSNEVFYIKANLSGDTSLLSFPDSFNRARKNSVDLFKDLINSRVLNVYQFENERSFSIQFEANQDLLFKLHGRHANIIQFINQNFESSFKKNQIADESIVPMELNKKIDQSHEAIIKEGFDLFKSFPTFDKKIKNYLKENGFYEDTNDQEKLKVLDDLVTELNKSEFYVTESDAKLYLFKPKQTIKTFNDPIEASNYLAKQFYQNYGYQQLKDKLLNQLSKDIKKSEAYITNTQNKLKEIENQRGYEELANILMANLHLKPNQSATSIKLYDFYSDKEIEIKIKPNLSLQLNAENLYRKAKNQNKEVINLKSNIKNKGLLLEELKEKQNNILHAQDTKALKALEKVASHTPVKTDKTFMEFIIDGFQVYAGKNAKNKDLWLHARDVSGSHVIIRNPTGEHIPPHTIEKVAQIAAWHSKRKSDTLCPVIFTPKKYVRKPKGALPGQVILTKEQVVLVKPQRQV